ncbi:MAG: hypothetical protein KKG00_01895, partial [Bacteroidetes bacterium]|nr:hypothetical protein [Bacteroidota bacterium]
LVFANRLPLIDRCVMTLASRGIVEVVVRKQKRDGLYRTALVGYSRVEMVSPESIERRRSALGFYGKLGNEWMLRQGRRRSSFGLRGMLTYSKFITDLVFPGPAFGDYQRSDLVQNAGIGIDPYYALDFFLGQYWLLRWETRWTHHYRIGGKGFTPYYPGVGISLGMYDYTHSLGTTLQLHYRFAGRKGNH